MKKSRAYAVSISSTAAIIVGLLTLIACTALPSYAADPAPIDFTATIEPAIDTAIDQGPSINVLIDRVVGWAPDWIIDPIKIWANYLIIGSSVLMLFLRLLVWFLPAPISQRFNWILGPIATGFRQLTRLLDVIAINSSGRSHGPKKDRRGG